MTSVKVKKNFRPRPPPRDLSSPARMYTKSSIKRLTVANIQKHLPTAVRPISRILATRLVTKMTLIA